MYTYYFALNVLRVNDSVPTYIIYKRKLYYNQGQDVKG